MRRIALLGAECTGKSRLARDLSLRLEERGWSCSLVDEYLRRWCEGQGRNPQWQEQAAIARAQAQAIAKASQADWLIADTTSLMTAVYGELLFDDRSLYPDALDELGRFDCILLCATDLPWQADGFLRDGPIQRDRFDAQLRATLNRANHGYRVIYGREEERLQNALVAIGASGAEGTGMRPGSGIQTAGKLQSASSEKGYLGRWRWSCEKCSDPECEHRLFTEQLRSKAADPNSA